MICDKCGSMIPDRSTSCPICKSKLTPKSNPIIPKKKGGSGRWLILVLAVVVVLAAAFFAWKYFAGGRGNETPDPTEGGASQPAVSTPIQSQPTTAPTVPETTVPQTSAPETTAPPETTVPPQTQPAESQPAESQPVAAQPMLPDLNAFLGGLEPIEEEPARENGWHLYYQMELEAGAAAAEEYVELLSDPRFQLTMRPRTEKDESTVLYLTSSFYFFDYTGAADVTPMRDRFYRDDYEDVTADVFVWIQKDTQNAHTTISVYYSADLAVTDLGDRASNADLLAGG